MNTVLYNDFNNDSVAWLRQLIENGDISDGEVVGGDFRELNADELREYKTVHLFAGVGGWDYALRLAGWSGPVWTASLPCQPFSPAGRGRGKDDDRHLLPDFLDLVAKCRPPVIFGEQSANAINISGQLRNKIEDLQYLQKKQAYLRILAELQGQSVERMFAMQREEKTTKEGFKRKELGDIREMEKEESRSSSKECCCTSSERKGDGVGHNGRMGSEKDRSRCMRGDRYTFQSGRGESMECSISGQDRQLYRVHSGEHKSCYLCPECDDEHLGRTEDIRSIKWNNESSQEEIRRAYAEISDEIAATIKHGWLDDLQTGLEAEGYTVGHCVLGAHSVGAPHIRSRLYWVAYRNKQGLERRQLPEECEAEQFAGAGGMDGGVAYSGERRHYEQEEKVFPGRFTAKPGGSIRGMVNPEMQGTLREPKIKHSSAEGQEGNDMHVTEQPSKISSRVGNSQIKQMGVPGVTWINGETEVIECLDGKYRPVQSSIWPLADGLPEDLVCGGNTIIPANETQEARKMRIHGYGNAIVPQVAAEFIKAFMNSIKEV